MSAIPLKESSKTDPTPLAKGNKAFRQGDFAQAITFYAQFMVENPELERLISVNLALSRKKNYSFCQSNSKPCVAFFSHNLKLQGAPKSLFELVTGLAERGAIKPIVLSPYDGPLRSQYEALSIPLIILDGGNIWNRKTGEQFNRAVKIFTDVLVELRPAVVFANTFTMFHAVYAAQQLGIPAILNPRESEPPETFFDEFPEDIRSLAYRTVSTTDRIIFVADATRRQWEFANERDSFAVIRNALPEESPELITSRSEDRKAARLTNGINDAETVFASVGTVTPRKGQLDIVEAFARLPAAASSCSRLLILGMAQNTYSQEIEGMVATMPLSLRSRVNLLPQTTSTAEASRVRDVYLAADVFILSSRIESYPRVILEAMAFGLPIITTPCFGVVEQVRDDIEALYYGEGDTKTLAQHMLMLIESPARRSALANAVRERAIALGTHDDMLRAYEKHISEVLGTASHLANRSLPNDNSVVSGSQHTMKLSICTVSRKLDNLERLFASLAQAGLPSESEVLVSWNGQGRPSVPSPAASVDVRVIENRPYNFAANNNSLSRAARGEFLLLVNDDVVLDRDAIQLMIAESERHGHAMVGPNLRYPNGKLQHAGVFFNDRWEPFHRYKHALHHSHPAVSRSCQVPAVTGACILMLRRDFDALGGFDEQFGVAGEDINLCVGFQTKLGKSIRYCAEATGIHVENVTRRETGERLTPPEDLLRIRQCAARLHSPGNEPGDGVRLSIHTEEPGWIMHRKAAEIQKLMKNTTINEDVWDADIHYYINYGYYFRSARHAQRRGLKVANFTHFDPDSLSEQFREAARVMDHCVSVSDETTKILRDFGVPEEKITTIVVGADIGFEPKLTLGIVGRVYKGGRKGEHLVNALLEDDALMAGLRIVATNEDWGVPVWNFDEQADFYRSVDYLLVPALIEGGPVPFMEALACGTLAIAPPIGVVPQFPHIPYRTGEIDSLKQVIQRVKSDFLQTRRRTASAMAGVDWLTWSLKHQQLFQRLVSGKEYVQISRCCVVPGYQAVSARRVMSAVESKPKQIKPESKDDS